MLTTPWDGWAEAYSVEAKKIDFYQVINRELVASGQIQPDMIIVDLACGSGLTTQNILALIGDDTCTIYAIDLSEEMLKIIRRSVTSRSVHLVHANANSFSRYIAQRVDRVFCNAAFWHFPEGNTVMREARAVLKDSGLFLFNLPDHEFDFADGKRSEMEQVVRECLQQPQREEDIRYSHQVIQTLATENGFRIAEFKVIEVGLPPEDLIRLCSIPPIDAPGFPGRSKEERREMLIRAFSHLTREQFPRYRWAQFALVPQKN